MTAGDGEAATDLTSAKSLKENLYTSYRGTTKNGAFDIPGELARQWLRQPNPNGQPNSSVLCPWANGLNITRRPSDTWIIDFGCDMAEIEAMHFELPYTHALEKVKPDRQHNRREAYRVNWWIYGEARPGLRILLKKLPRYLATAMVSKHRYFVWLPTKVLPDQQVIVIGRSDDTTFGILHSRFHELWALKSCSWMGVGNDPRYTPTTCFETFPFPEGLTPADTAPKNPELRQNLGDADGATPDFTKPVAATIAHAAQRAQAQTIAEAAFKLNQLRENWLNPTEWVDWVITPQEEKAGFPRRPVAKPGFEADLKKRTLTNLYNAKPAWLVNAHRVLDQAVAKAYGWTDYTPEMPDTEILQRLLKLNLAR